MVANKNARCCCLLFVLLIFAMVFLLVVTHNSLTLKHLVVSGMDTFMMWFCNHINSMILLLSVLHCVTWNWKHIHGYIMNRYDHQQDNQANRHPDPNHHRRHPNRRPRRPIHHFNTHNRQDLQPIGRRLAPYPDNDNIPARKQRALEQYVNFFEEEE